MMRTLVILLVLLCSWTFAQEKELVLSASGATSYPCSLAFEILAEDGAVVRAGFVELESPRAQAVITAKLPSKIAVQVYEDENRNQKLDRGFFTQPLEHYGFSKDAWSPLSKPSLEEMLIDVTGHRSRLHINLRHVGSLK